MRYIRTKDGNYGWIMTEEKRKALIGCARGDYGFSRFNILVDREADTIEELCDEAVVIDQSNHNKPIVILCGGNGKPFPTAKTFYPFATIYGAIWTDEGLIYVAQMNKEGELELL